MLTNNLVLANNCKAIGATRFHFFEELIKVVPDSEMNLTL